nr:MAG TPA: hypothetical protein [Caudoviricetes sp.]
MGFSELSAPSFHGGPFSGPFFLSFNFCQG